MVDTSSALSCASFCPFFTKSAGEPGLDEHYHLSFYGSVLWLLKLKGNYTEI